MKNREILFRGQHRRKGERVWMDGTPVESRWIYGGVCQGEGDFSIIYQTEPDIHKFPVYTDTLGQFTGLYDSTQFESLLESEQKEWLNNHTADEWKGRKIFEGDILDLTHYLIMDVGVVRFGEYKDLDMGNDYPCGHVGFYADVEKQRISVRKDILFFVSECKILGNVHDNPELLKGER